MSLIIGWLKVAWKDMGLIEFRFRIYYFLDFSVISDWDCQRAFQALHLLVCVLMQWCWWQAWDEVNFSESGEYTWVREFIRSIISNVPRQEEAPSLGSHNKESQCSGISLHTTTQFRPGSCFYLTNSIWFLLFLLELQTQCSINHC